MYNATLMRMRERLGHLFAEMQNLTPCQCAAPVHILSQCDPVHQLHNYVFEIIVVADVVYGYDIWMGQHRDRVCLRAEAAAKILVGSHIITHYLYGNVTVESVVKGFVDQSHAAFAYDLQYLISFIKQHADVFVVVFHSILRFGGLLHHCDYRYIVSGTAFKRLAHKRTAYQLGLLILLGIVKHFQVGNHI